MVHGKWYMVHGTAIHYTMHTVLFTSTTLQISLPQFQFCCAALIFIFFVLGRVLYLCNTFMTFGHTYIFFKHFLRVVLNFGRVNIVVDVKCFALNVRR